MLSVTPSTTAARPAQQRRAFAVLMALAVALAALVGAAPQAHAANYVYWSYWQVTAGKWTYYTVGSDQSTPADGSVEGWRWGIDDGTGSRAPRMMPTFEQLCGTTAAQPGMKRVGLVVDFGRDADGDGTTPPPAAITTCVVAPPAATGTALLAKAGGVRTDQGLTCAIGGYPASGCSVQLASLTDAQKAADTPLAMPTTAPTTAATTAPTTAAVAATSASAASGGTSPVLWVLLFVLAAGIAYAVARRRRPTGV